MVDKIKTLFYGIAGKDGRATAADFKRFLLRYDADKNGRLNAISGEEMRASRALGINIKRYFYKQTGSNAQGPIYSGLIIDSDKSSLAEELPYALVMKGAGREWRKGMTIDQFKQLVKRYGR